MAEDSSWADLGFVATSVPAGSHICHIYSDGAERDRALLRFLSSGLTGGEKTGCFWDDLAESTVREWLESEGVSFDDEKSSGNLTMTCAESIYFENGCFDPDRILSALVGFHAASLEHKGARVIGEMTPRILQIDGGSRLFEYESRVNSVLREHPITTVCQYNARAFDGATIMDVLSVHPMMVMHGNVIRNPFFTPPEQLARR